MPELTTLYIVLCKKCQKIQGMTGLTDKQMRKLFQMPAVEAPHVKTDKVIEAGRLYNFRKQ